MTGRVLVVGGAGYVGSHMTLALAEAGYAVTVFDNLCRGHRDAVLGATLVEGDIRRPSDLRRCFAESPFDLVMHFAALAYVGESVREPAKYYATNAVGSLNLLEAMREAAVARIVFSSTCATYGVCDMPIDEAQPKNPVNPYGASKLFVEQALESYGAAYGISSISLRYFNAAGCDRLGRLGERHDPETHLIPRALREAMRVRAGGDPSETGLTVFGTDFETPDGTCIRDYVHVEDLCLAHLLAARRVLNAPGARAEAFNLGLGRGYSVLQVIEACRRVTGCDIRFGVAPRRPGDPPRLVASASLARRVLGWGPQIDSLDQIIETAWRWMTRERGRSSGSAVEAEPAPWSLPSGQTDALRSEADAPVRRSPQ